MAMRLRRHKHWILGFLTAAIGQGVLGLSVWRSIALTILWAVMREVDRWPEPDEVPPARSPRIGGR